MSYREYSHDPYYDQYPGDMYRYDDPGYQDYGPDYYPREEYSYYPPRHYEHDIRYDTCSVNKGRYQSGQYDNGSSLDDYQDYNDGYFFAQINFSF